MSDPLGPHGLSSPWNYPGQNTEVGSLSLLRGIFPTRGLNPSLPHCRQILYQLSHKGSRRILEWVAYPFSSGSSQPKNRTWVSCIEGGFFTNWAMREAPKMSIGLCIYLWVLYLVPLAYISVFVPVPYCLGNCSFVLVWSQELTSISSHIHNWVLFLLWLCLFILSGLTSSLISSSMLGTYQPGEFIFQCPIFLLFHTVHGVLKARI